jgi:hypothetical protein
LRRNVFFYAQDPQPRKPAVGFDTRPLVLQLHRPRLPPHQNSDALSNFLREGIANQEPIALKGAAARSKAAKLLADGELLSCLLRKEGFEALKERLWPLRDYVAAGGGNALHGADDANERNLDRDAEVLCLVASAPELECANSLIATGSDVVAGVTAANAVSNHLGVGEGSAAADAYSCKYVSKDDSELNRSLDVFAAMHEKVTVYRSTADDSGADDRTAKHFIAAVLNHSSEELEAVQVAANLMMVDASYQSRNKKCLWICVSCLSSARFLSPSPLLP